MASNAAVSSNMENIKSTLSKPKDSAYALSSELLKEAIDEAEAYYEKYQCSLAELDTCKSAHAKLRQENHALALKHAITEKEKQEFKDDFEKVFEALSIADEEIASSKRALLNLEQAHVTLKTAHDAELKRREETVQALQVTKAELETLRAKLQCTREKYAKSTTEAIQLQVLLEKEMDEKAALRAQMCELNHLFMHGPATPLTQTTATQTAAAKDKSSSAAWDPNTMSSVPKALTQEASRLSVEDVTDEEDVRVELQLPGSAVKLSVERADPKAHVRERSWVSKLRFKDT